MKGAFSFIILIAILWLVATKMPTTGGVLNKVFSRSKMADGKAEMNRAFSWTSDKPIESVISAIRADLALPTEAKLTTHTYVLRQASASSLVIGYGKKLGDSFVMQVGGRNSGEAGSQGALVVPTFTLVDGMPSHVDKMSALRDRILTIIHQSGGVVTEQR